MKRTLCLFLAAAMVVLASVVSVSAAGTATVSVIAPESVTENSSFNITVRVNNVPAGKHIAMVEFDIDFDESLVTADYSQTLPNDNSRITVAPGDWEQMIRSKNPQGAALGYYACSLCPSDGGINIDNTPTAACLSEGETLEITLPFVAKKNVAGSVANFTVTNIYLYDATDANLDTYIDATAVNGSTAIEAATLPVQTLGAMINTRTSSLRLGATYTKSLLDGYNIDVTDVEDIGIVFCPTKFVSGELTKETAAAAAVSAAGIVEYDPELVFADYETFTFYVTIVRIPSNGLNTNISFRAYLETEDTLLYAADTLVRSYKYVHDVTFGTTTGGDGNIKLEEGDNIIYCPSNWFE